MAGERKAGERAKSERLTRALASAALGVSLVALVLAGYSLYAQQRAEEDLRQIGRELSRTLGPRIPQDGPPLGLDPDDT
jgi:hypothetical protein